MAMRYYRVALTLDGPIHIGDGEKYGGKDYFLRKERISVIDSRRLVSKLTDDQLDRYCRFLEEDSRTGLHDFLEREPEIHQIADGCMLYQVDGNLTQDRRGLYQYFDVLRFVKDACGYPYVPGSSVKGLFRTALLTYLVAHDRSKFALLYDRNALLRDTKRTDRAIQRRALWLERPVATDANLVNDIMKYVAVSDSDPLPTSSLAFVKKYDKFSKRDDGRHKKDMGRMSDSAYYAGNKLNIYRECLKPGTQVSMMLTVDEAIDTYLGDLKLDTQGLYELMKFSYDLYEKDFLDHFDMRPDALAKGEGGSGGGRCHYIYQSGLFAGSCCRNSAIGTTGYCHTHQSYALASSAAAGCPMACSCYLGGGTGFAAHTIVSALFDDVVRVSETSHILYKQFPTRIASSMHAELRHNVLGAGFKPHNMRALYRNGHLEKAKQDHRHWRDSELGVSPHTLKMGKIGASLYEMGKCQIRFEELT